jgi:hypothetical protein
MTYKIILKEQRAQLVVKELNNATRITSEPDHEGWVSIEVHINNGYDALSLYHAGMRAQMQAEKEFAAERKVSVTVA